MHTNLLGTCCNALRVSLLTRVSIPPEARLTMRNFPNSLWGSTGGNRLLMLSLKAKLKAWVGKYLITCKEQPVLVWASVSVACLLRYNGLAPAHLGLQWPGGHVSLSYASSSASCLLIDEALKTACYEITCNATFHPHPACESLRRIS